MTSLGFSVRVHGRPAPQGSKRLGEHGQLLEQSPYLHAWRGQWKGAGARRRYEHGAVGRAVYESFRDRGVMPDELPLLRGPVAVGITFYVDSDPTAPPDLDKLARSTFDALTVCRVWDDDARAVEVFLRKVAATPDEPAGAFIYVHPARDVRTSVNLTRGRRRARLLAKRWRA